MKKKLTKLVVAGILLMGTSLAWAAVTAQDPHSANYNEMMKNIEAFEAQWNEASNAIAKFVIDDKYNAVDKEKVVWSNLTKYLNEKAEIKKTAVNAIEKAEAEWQADQKLGDKKKGVAEPALTLDDEVVAMLNDNILSGFDGKADGIWEAWKACEINNLDVAINIAGKTCDAVKNEEWFKNVSPNKIDGVRKSAEKAKENIATAIAGMELDVLQGACKTEALNVQDNAKAITEAVNNAADKELNDVYTKVLGYYNAIYTKMSEKYEGTDILREKQEEFVNNYLKKLTAASEIIKANKNAEILDVDATTEDDEVEKTFSKTSSAIYGKTIKDITDVQALIEGNKEELFTELEQAIVAKNNALYEKWANGTEIKGSYGEVYANYLEAVRKMNKYKTVVNDAFTEKIITGTEKDKTLSKIETAESALYAPYTAIQKQKTDVLAALEKANSSVDDRTTQYLSDLIEEYNKVGREELNVQIEEAVEDAKAAVKDIAIEFVLEKAIRVNAQKVYTAYNEIEDKYNAKIVKNVQDAIDGINLAWYNKKNISDIKRSDVSYDEKTEEWSYNGKDEITAKDVVDADNYEEVIKEITTTFNKELETVTALWTKRSDIINAEEKADKDIKAEITRVRAYWTEAYGKISDDATKVKELEALRADIDKLEKAYKDAVDENNKQITENGKKRDKFEWEKTAIQNIKDATLAGLTKSYNAIYPYAEPEAAQKTADAKKAAEDAVKALQESITKAKAALTTASEDKKADLQNAIATAEKALTDAQGQILVAATLQGSQADEKLNGAKTTADKAKTALDAAIENASVIEGDYNGDGVVDMADVDAVMADADGTTVTNEQVLQIVKAYVNR